ncbi:MAG: LysE family translocator [Bacteroidaceae bacterium]|nr:LysE family translocator [Bacteroidaceae bacterium]MBR3984085.1 LysE family translocator [Bacteroidaceae bacterium]
MNWLEQFVGQISIVEIMLKGIIIGIIVSAPMGPVGVMCIRRTLNKGRWHGFMTGIGASVSDLVYATITALGMSFVFDFINNAHNMFVLQVVGSILLFFFGLHTFRTNPHSYRANPMDKLGSYPVTKSKLAYNFATGFALAISNPLVILMFVALFARMSFVLPELDFVERVAGYASIWMGAVVWWFAITWLVGKLGSRFDVRGIWLLNRVIGSAVMIFGILGIAYTLIV